MLKNKSKIAQNSDRMTKRGVWNSFQFVEISLEKQFYKSIVFWWVAFLFLFLAIICDFYLHDACLHWTTWSVLTVKTWYSNIKVAKSGEQLHRKNPRICVCVLRDKWIKQRRSSAKENTHDAFRELQASQVLNEIVPGIAYSWLNWTV